MRQMDIVLGTRGSALALKQTEWVAARLRQACPQCRITLQVIRTRGDQIQHLPLNQIGDKGLFVTESEQQILSGQVTIGVHSLKDLPSSLQPGCCLGPALAAEDPRDALVLRQGGTLQDLPKQAVIATGSARRRLQLLQLRPDLNVVGIRGNIDTRLQKMEQQQLDGLVLAAAGLKRMGLEDRISTCFEPEQMVSACGQGILGLEVRSDNTAILQLLSRISDETATLRMIAERSWLKEIGGSCHIPAGARLKRQANQWVLYAMLADESGRMIRARRCVDPQRIRQQAIDLARQMKEELNA